MSTVVSDLHGISGKSEETPLRFVTAASLFDGHDAAINIMRRLIQAQGAEVVHLGHNRSVADVVNAAIQEDADGIAVSSYQGGHNEYFRYMIDQLNEAGAGHIRVFGGGGGTITPEEISALMDYGVERIYHPHDGMELGLEAMIRDLVERTAAARRNYAARADATKSRSIGIANTISAIEEHAFEEATLSRLRKEWQVKAGKAPVLGITGTGGAGKSSVTDELLNRFLTSFPEMRIAVLAVDPTRRRTGGALLGDRIRMNSLRSERIYMRSIATRRQHLATSEMLGDHILYLKSLGFDLIIVETAGIGQSDSEIVDLVDYSVYVMTSDYGAASQLEKIDMLDFADLVVLNKYDKRGAEDAHCAIFGSSGSATMLQFDSERMKTYPSIRRLRASSTIPVSAGCSPNCAGAWPRSAGLDSRRSWKPDIDTSIREPRSTAAMIPGQRIRYLAEISPSRDGTVNSRVDTQARNGQQGAAACTRR